MTPASRLRAHQPLRRLRDRLATAVIVAGAMAVLAAILAIGVFLLWQSLPVLSMPWSSVAAKLSGLAFGTLKAALVTLVFAVPVALGAAIYTALYLPARQRQRIKPALEMMEAVPGVVVGFIAGVILAPWVEQHLASALALLLWPPASALLAGLVWRALAPRRLTFHHAWLWLMPWLLAMGALALWLAPVAERLLPGGSLRTLMELRLGLDYATRNAMIVGVAMGFAVVPGIYALAEDALSDVPKTLTEGAQALGADRWQTLWRVALPAAGPGIFSAVLIGAGRAVGETMIVLMASSNAALIDPSPLTGMRTVAAAVAIELPEAAPASADYQLLMFAAFALFLFTFLVNTLAETIRLRLRARLKRQGGRP